MFAEKVGQPCSTTGTGSFALPVASTFTTHRTWRSGFSTGASAFYLATNDLGTIWEIGHGTFTTGSPDTLTRNLIASSSGALIDWVTVPYRVYSVPVAAVLSSLISGGLGTALPAWAPAGFSRWDHTDGISTRWSLNLNTAGGEREMARYEVAQGMVALSPRRPWTDVGAANQTVTANHIGHRFKFNTTAAVRTCTLPAGSSVGVGFAVDIRGTGPYYGVAIVPNGTDIVGGLPAGATFTTLPRTKVSLMWDGTEWEVLGHSSSLLGVPIPYLGATLPSAHVWGNGTTIGATSSGATRANDDTWMLFEVFWAALADAESAMLTSAGAGSTRGASAASDWSANKRLTVPDHRDRFLVGKADIGGAADAALISLFSTTVLGKAGGAEGHTHTGTTGGASSFVNVTGGGGTSVAQAHTHTITTGSTAAIPPAIVGNVIYRLY